MKIDLTCFLAIPDDWAIKFASDQITEDDVQRGLVAARRVLDAANLHPSTSFIAYQFLNAEWHEFLADRMLATGLDEWAVLCAWADVWEAAEGAATSAALSHLPVGEVRYFFYVSFPNAPEPEDGPYVRDENGEVHAMENRFSSYLKPHKLSD